MGQEEGAEGPRREGEVSDEPVTHDCSEPFSPHTLKEPLEVSMVLKDNTIQYNNTLQYQLINFFQSRLMWQNSASAGWHNKTEAPEPAG